MAFYEDLIFPVAVSRGSRGGPQFSTDVVILGSGNEQRNINWEFPLCKYNVAWGIHKSEDYLDLLIAFFRIACGMAHGFLYKDWSDYTGSGEVIGTGDASETSFQLVKTYTSAAIDAVRTINKPKSGSVKIYFDSVEQTSGWSVDTTTGKVTFSSAPGNGVVISADYEFYVPCRFDIDHMPISLDYYDAHTMPDVPVLELRM